MLPLFREWGRHARTPNSHPLFVRTRPLPPSAPLTAPRNVNSRRFNSYEYFPRAWGRSWQIQKRRQTKKKNEPTNERTSAVGGKETRDEDTERQRIARRRRRRRNRTPKGSSFLTTLASASSFRLIVFLSFFPSFSLCSHLRFPVVPSPCPYSAVSIQRLADFKTDGSFRTRLLSF